MGSNRLIITQFPKISAIYYGLLQSGYDYFSLERSPEHIALLYDYIGENRSSSFFSEASQNTCDVYSYRPRAYIMEAASFYLDDSNTKYRDFDLFHGKIMSAGNITEKERDDSLWSWISGFPKALSDVLSLESFSKYAEWEKKWINEQNNAHKQELELINRCLDYCLNQWQSPEKAKGNVLLTDTVRFICKANGYDAEKIGQHFLEFCRRSVRKTTKKFI